MSRVVYYSPFGGAVDAVVKTADPSRELAVMQGAVRKASIDDAHALCQHIDDKTQPTSLAGWKCDGSRVFYELPAETASAMVVGEGAAIAAAADARAAADAARAEAAALREQVSQLLTELRARPLAQPTSDGGGS